MIEQELQQLIKKVVKDLYNFDAEVVIERPKDSMHGDFSSNIAMALAKELKKSPMEIAEIIVKELRVTGYELPVDKIEIAGAGFINFYINKGYYSKNLMKVIEQGNDYGRSNLGEGKKVMIEFGQPNTHKAFHVGHLKSAISGLSMVRLHENLGYNVIKANYFGDVGMQVAKTTWGYLNQVVPGNIESMNVHERMAFIDSCYVYGANKFKEDPEAEKQIRAINKEIYEEKDTENVRIYKLLRQWSVDHQKDIWKTLGITYDREYPESEVAKDALKIVDKFRDMFEESEGAIIYRGEKVGLTNWVFITKEGNPTYSAKDLGLGYKKFEEYPDLFKAIVTTSVEIADYFKVVIHILNTINPETKGRYFHIPFGWLLFNNRKESSRSGKVPKGMEIIDEIKQVTSTKISDQKEYRAEERMEIIWKVAIAGLKFLILSHEFHKDINYDPENFLSFEGYSGPYIMYAYTRAKSILRQVDAPSKEEFGETVFKIAEENALIKCIEKYPEVAFAAGVDIAPHTVCNYLYELAQKFNKFYTVCQVINADTVEDKKARLLLTKATAQVLKNGLNLLGIETVEKM